MEFGFSVVEEALIQEVRSFLKEKITPEILAEAKRLGPIYGGPRARELMREFGARGWIAPNWPKR